MRPGKTFHRRDAEKNREDTEADRKILAHPAGDPVFSAFLCSRRALALKKSSNGRFQFEWACR
jgi:hypothetical protein